ncbi:putative prophage protein [Escherichia coli]|nr:putative prophage protein [Escherichia coli]
MMNIEELRKIFCEDGLYAVCVENGNLVSHYRIMCLRKNGAALINFVDARVTDGFILREGEFVTSLQALKEIGIKAGFSSLYIDLCNCLILICSIQHQMKVNLWTKNSYRLWLTNWPKTSKPLKTSVSLIGC